MIQSIVYIITSILFIYLALNTLYFFIVAVVGKFYKGPAYEATPNKKKIAVLIPTYKEDNIIVHTARKAVEHNYPGDKFTVFIAADQLQPETIAQLRAIPVNVQEVKFEISSKARSLNKLLNAIPEDEYDIAMVLDADNIMEPGCLEKVNAAFQKGFRAVQTHRIAKNNNTPVALLDAMSEEINNHLFRRGQRALGFSSALIGSGMAFEFKRLKEIYNKPGILGNPACDREVDFEMLRDRTVLEFIDNAYVLDEKVSSREVYERQRMRWLESQIIHLRLFFDKKGGHIPRSKDFWNKLFNNLAAPRLLFLLSFFIIGIIILLQWFTGISILFPATGWWLGLMVMYFLTFVIAIPSSFYNRQTARAIAHIPLLMFSMVKAMLKMNVGRKEFIHTPKTFSQDTPQ